MASAPPSRRRARRAAARATRGEGAGHRRRAPLLLALGAVLALLGSVALVRGITAWFTDPLERGRAALAAADYRAARVDFSAALTDDPANLAARIDLARALNGLDRGVEAERQLARARELGASPTAVRVETARALSLQARDADALTALAGPVSATDRAAALVAAGWANYRLGRIDAADRAFRAATDAPQANDTGDALIAMARYRLAEQDLLGADAAADAAWRRAPGSVTALVVKADVVLARAGPVAALPWYQAALETKANDVPALVGLAAALGEAGRARDMLVPLRRAAGIEPGSPRIVYLQAVLAARGGEPALARTLLSRIGGREADRPGVLLLRAAVELALDTPAAARNAAGRLVDLQPDNRAARRLLAASLAALDDQPATIAVLDPITTKPDADTWSLLLLSNSFASYDWLADALQPLDRAATLAHGDPVALPASAITNVDSLEPSTAIPTVRALMANGRTQDARALAARLAQANPGVPQAQLLFGDASGAAGDDGAAIAAYRAAANLRFDEMAMLRLVAALARSGDGDGARAAVDSFAAHWPANGTAMRIQAAMAAERGDWGGAISALAGALARVGPNDALLLSQLARAHIEVGERIAAIPFAARAYRLLPGNATISGVYGRALWLGADGRRRDARDLLEKAVKLAPGDRVLRGWLRATVAR